MNSDTFRAYGLALLAGLDYYLAAENVSVDPGPDQQGSYESLAQTADQYMITYLAEQDTLYHLDPNRSLALDQQLIELFTLPRTQREAILENQARVLSELGQPEAARALARRIKSDDKREMLLHDFAQGEDTIEWLPDPEPEEDHAVANREGLIQLPIDFWGNRHL